MSVPYWRLSGFYFFYFATLGGFLPYWSLYLKSLGFNPGEIGELSAFLVGTKIIAPNIWGWIADYTGKSLRIIRIACFLSACLFAAFLWVRGYFWFAAITVAFSFFWNAALPQFEAATLFHLKSERHRYSEIRLWGSVGFIATVVFMGWLLDSLTIEILPQVITVLLIVLWLAALITPEAKATVGERGTVRISHLLMKPEIIAFFTVYLLIQLAHGPYYVFFSLFLKSHGYSSTMTGVLWSLGVVAEIILFLFMRKILARFSLRKILLTSLVLSIVRWNMIAYFPDHIGLLIGAQVLHAATFGATHVAAIHLVDHYFGHQHQGKGQALYSSMSFGLGGMLGSLYSGYLWESWGPERVYALAAVSCAVALIIAYIWVGRDHAQKAIAQN